MAPKGRTPSLIGSGAGAVKITMTQKKSKCKRCKQSIPGKTSCAKVGVPGTMGSRTYCVDCFRGILEKTEQNLHGLQAEVAAL
jgi:hypothetical protein